LVFYTLLPFFLVPPFYYGSQRSAQDTSLRFRFQSEFIGFYRYLVIRKVAMCQFGTSDESFQNHHLAGTRVTVKLALIAGPSGKLVELAIKYKIYNSISFFLKVQQTLDKLQFLSH
jgi:hypothetical protein